MTKRITRVHPLILFSAPLLFALFIFCNKQPAVTILPPEELYGQLFHDVQSNRTIFTDSKTFPDCTPEFHPETIRKKYAVLPSRSDSSLAQFVRDNFIIPAAAPVFTAESLSIHDHIRALWRILQRPPDERKSGTLIPLSRPYIVPGGRFREIYYWDSYFTMLGLREDSEFTIMQNMVDNFSYLIDTYGFIPNGNRTYYLSRSQPPFYSMMVSLLAECNGDRILGSYIPRIEKEYAFWMDGSDRLHDSITACKRVVHLPDGSILNRYWDDNAIPRAESYREDITTAEYAMQKGPRFDKKSVFRNLRAAAESGWDFSSRWLSRDKSGMFALFTIHTTDLIPIDLNSLLFKTEKMLCEYHENTGNTIKAETFRSAFENRRKAIYNYCWNSDSGYFYDYNFRNKKKSDVISVAGFYPFFFTMADSADAPRAADILRRHLLFPGGIAATVNATGQQWDKPNGWAPLQWISVTGLRNYGHTSLADTIADRWCHSNQKVYQTQLKMYEKYNVVDTTKESGGGEYPTQDGFGWTNGVYKALCAQQSK